ACEKRACRTCVAKGSDGPRGRQAGRSHESTFRSVAPSHTVVDRVATTLSAVGGRHSCARTATCDQAGSPLSHAHQPARCVRRAALRVASRKSCVYGHRGVVDRGKTEHGKEREVPPRSLANRRCYAASRSVSTTLCH